MSWTQLRDLTERFGESFYVFYPEKFRRNCTEFGARIKKVYSNVRLAHSYKTNSLPAICRLSDELGLYAETVSDAEYEQSIRLGIDGRNILFNGPARSAKQLENALINGSTVILDNEQDLTSVERICSKHADKKFRVGLRVTFDIGTHVQSRFGFDSTSDSFENARRRAEQLPNNAFSGLHCHFSCAREAGNFRKRAEGLIELADRCFGETPPQFLDIGGGFCGRMPQGMRNMFSYGVPDFAEYAESLAEPFARRYGSDAPCPEVIVEPGMGLLCDVQDFLCSVYSVKEIGGQRIATCTGSIFNTQPLSRHIPLPVSVVPASPRPTSQGKSDAQLTAIAGHTCMEVDMLHPGISHPVSQGDILIFHNVGAYTNALTPHFFIHPNPTIISFESSNGDQPSVLRRRQTLDDRLQACESLTASSPFKGANK